MRLLLSGYYGFGNLGDEAILEGLIGGLTPRGFELTVLSHAPRETRAAHGVMARARLAGAIPALVACDALVSGGGGLLQDVTSRRSLRYYLALVRLAKRLGKRALIYGQSVGPLSAAGRAEVAAALAGVPVAVRDEASQRLLAELGLAAALTADAALLLEPPPVEKTEATLLIPRAGYPEITEALARLARSLLAAGQRVALSAVQAGEDEPELAHLLARAPGLERWAAASVSELLAHAGRARYVVSGRLHGLVLAAAAGTGFAGLVYDPKVRAFLAEAGAPVFELPAPHERLLECARMRPVPPPQKLAAMRARARSGIDWLEAQLRAP